MLGIRALIQLLSGDCRSILPTLPDASVQCVVTSPPYYGLRGPPPASEDAYDRDMRDLFEMAAD